MAGPDPTGAFNAAEFRAAITSVMTMGLPDSAPLQATFVFVEQETFAAEGFGPETDPYDWTATPTTDVAQTTVVVPVAVQYASAGTPDAEGGVGEFDASRATLTLLDTDYAKVEGASRVLIGGYTYMIDAPGAIPMGLFDVTVFQLHVSARS